MGLFSSASGKSITTREFQRKVLPALRSAGFNERQIKGVSQIFSGDLHEGKGERDIVESEVESRLKWMGDNLRDHDIDRNQLATLKQTLLEHM